MTKNIYQQNLCRLDLHSKSNFIEMIWEGNLSNDEYKAFWQAYLQEQKKLDRPHLLVDQRNIGKVDMKARAWFVLNFLPAHQAEVRKDLCVAIMQPQNILGKTAIQYLVSAVNNLTQYKVRLFEDRQAALVWLDLVYKQEVYERSKNS